MKSKFNDKANLTSLEKPICPYCFTMYYGPFLGGHGYEANCSSCGELFYLKLDILDDGNKWKWLFTTSKK